jgi:biopolymer transport protein TolR
VKTHWKCMLTAGLVAGLLFAAISLLIYPKHASAQQENQKSSAAISGRGGRGISNTEQLERIRTNAEQGNPIAQFNLGARYANGDGVEQDNVRAYMWLTLSIENTTDRYAMPQAAGNGMAPPQAAINLRESVVKKMTPKQIEESQKLVEQWADDYVNRMDKVLQKKGDVTGVVGPDVVVVSLSEAGQIAINNKPVSFLNLGKELQVIYSTLSNKKMFVNASPRVIYSDVVRIIDIAQGVGVGEIGLVAEEINFTIMTSFLQEGISVNLPNAKNPVEDKDSGKADAIVIALNRDGRLFLKKQPITDPGLYDYLMKRYSSGEINRTVYLRADQSLMYGRVIQIVEVCRDAGVDRIGLMAEKD